MNDSKTKDAPLEIEHCYSGFLGFPYVAFIWSGKKLVRTICKDNNAKYKCLVGVHTEEAK